MKISWKWAGTAVALCFATHALHAEIANGTVFHDIDENGVWSEGDQPLQGVGVSNGVDIVKTDAAGKYELNVTDDTNIFVIKPSGYRTQFNEHHLPEFYYIHKPDGSPSSKFPGVSPTGPLPESIDFPLYKQDEPEEFRAVLWADPQPRNEKEIEYITRDVIEELIGIDASFGVTLGDIMFDKINLMDDLNMRVAMIGIPWYNVIGNHDINRDATVDKYSDETFTRIYGPNYYSFNYGTVHFIVMDTVDWFWPKDGEKGKYRGGIDAEQMAFIKNDLAEVPEDQLLVMLMHIPLTSSNFRQVDREEFFDLFEDRPFTLSVSGHTHYNEHVMVGKNLGWDGPEPHHHLINVTVSGSWWSGAPDELGIPHTTMRDGAPNGYSIVTFDGTEYKIEFKAARRPADYQMNIYAPESVKVEALGETEVIVNVFAGSKKSTVFMKIDETGAWQEMKRHAGKDPQYLALKAQEKSENPPNGRNLPKVRDTPHLWKATLPQNIKPGSHTIHVKTTDMFGQVYADERVLIVEN